MRTSDRNIRWSKMVLRSWHVSKIDISFILLSHVSNYFYSYLNSIPIYLIHCIRSILTYFVLTLTPVKMWFAPQMCNKTVHLVTPAVLKKLNMSSSNSKQKIVYHCLFRDPWFYFGAMLFHYLYANLRLGLIQDLLGFHFL